MKLHLLRAENCRCRQAPSRRALPVWALGLLLTACASTGPWPDVDLEAVGWTVQTGQAVWQPRGVETAIAGDVLIAEHANGDVLISFTKSALPIFTARTADRSWRLDTARRERPYSGHGRPPGRLIWFRLPAMLAGAEPPPKWKFEATGELEWKLERIDGSESVRLFLDR